MRADRLISMLMLLRSRGRLTADALAAELEVSVRTVYRDLDALSAAGIPVYAGRGPGGGCSLLEDYRTSLAALTEDEVRTLFLISIPEPLLALGMGPVLKTAFHKLYAAMPGLQNTARSRPAQVHLDWAGWKRAPSSPLLPVIYQALGAGRRLYLHYQLGNLADVDQEVDPWGLVAKAGEWYLVFAANGKLRAWPVAGLIAARPVDTPARLPPDFDLAATWQELCARTEAGSSSFGCTVRASAPAVPALVRRFGAWVDQVPPGPDGWRELELPYSSFYAAREHLLGLGRAVEVLKPGMLRLSLLDYARQVVSLYTEKSGG